MPNPKRRHSKQRRDKRRTHDKAVCLHWEHARIAELLFSTTGFVPSVVIIKENLQLRKRLPLNCNHITNDLTDHENRY